MSDETGFIGNSHRDFLEGEEKTNPSQYKKRIRERTEAAMLDFYYLFEYMEDEQVRKTFGYNFAPPVQTNHQKIADENTDVVEEDTTEDVYQPPATAAYVEYAIAFLLQGLNYGDERIVPGYEEATGEQQPAFEYFTEALEHGIERYVREKQGFYTDVDVNIELSNTRDELLPEIEGESDEVE